MRLIQLTIMLLAMVPSIAQTNCDKYTKDYIPVNLDDALNYLDCTWAGKEAFKNKAENDAIGDSHSGSERMIRNEWQLWERKGSLYKQFKSLGITFPEDISSIIMASFHRRLNGRDIDLTGQINAYKIQKKHRESITEERNLRAKRIKVGDLVSVVFSRQLSTSDRYDLTLLGYNSSLENSGNCLISGHVQNKKKAGGSVILTIEVSDLRNCENSYYGDKIVKTGVSFTYNMTYFNLNVIESAHND